MIYSDMCLLAVIPCLVIAFILLYLLVRLDRHVKNYLKAKQKRTLGTIKYIELKSLSTSIPTLQVVVMLMTLGVCLVLCISNLSNRNGKYLVITKQYSGDNSTINRSIRGRDIIKEHPIESLEEYDIISLSCTSKDISVSEFIKYWFNSDSSLEDIYSTKVNYEDNTVNLEIDGVLKTSIDNGVTYYKIGDYCFVGDDSNNHMSELSNNTRVKLSVTCKKFDKNITTYNIVKAETL